LRRSHEAPLQTLWRARSDAPRQPVAVQAFTRLELLALLAGLALLAAVALPALAGPRQRSQRVMCANNLRQIVAAVQLWGADHRDTVPWELPLADGGTRLHVLGANPWLHFSWLSNELASPVVLLCPSDTGRPAQDFSGDPARGYIHPNFANRATSYFLAHSRIGHPTGLMAGDRNLGFDATTVCSAFPIALSLTTFPLSPSFAWNTNLHNQAGNIVRLDGRVEQFSNLELRADLQAMRPDDNRATHYITPR
jgi:type II secretory pathway pseudopilin PulG